MCDASIVTVANTLHNLLEDAFRFFLFKSTILLAFQVAMQAATSNILHDQNDILGSIYHLVQANNVLVSHLFHEFDLALDTFASVGIEEFGFLVDLHGDFLVRGAVEADSDDCVGALSDLFANYIVI